MVSFFLSIRRYLILRLLSSRLFLQGSNQRPRPHHVLSFSSRCSNPLYPRPSVSAHRASAGAAGVTVKADQPILKPAPPTQIWIDTLPILKLRCSPVLLSASRMRFSRNLQNGLFPAARILGLAVSAQLLDRSVSEDGGDPLAIGLRPLAAGHLGSFRGNLLA